MEMTRAMAGGLTVTPHPLTLDGQRFLPAQLFPGETLHAFLGRHVPNLDSGAWAVTIGGFEVPRARWTKTRPKAGTIIECRGVVHKDVARIVAVVALSYFTLGAGGLAVGSATSSAGFFAAGGAVGGGFLAAAAVYVAGSIIINKVLAPAVVDPGALRDIRSSPTYSLAGGRNRARMYEPIGLLFGELQVAPDYASIPYTWFEGDDQYQYAIFHAGINCASVAGLKIGQTPIASYSDVTTRTAGISGMTDEELHGWSNVDAVSGAQLENTGTPAWVTRTSSSNTVVLQADFEGSLYAINADGSLAARSMTVSGEYRLLPSGSFLPFFDGASTTVVITNASTKPLRRTYSKTVDAGQYEIRFRKDTLDVQGSSEVNIVSWNQLKSVQLDTGTYGGMGRLGLKIQASGQLNGALDELRWTATAKSMPYWNGSIWTTATTRANGLSNPGAQILLFARGIYDDDSNLIAGLGLDDAQIDIESLQGFMERCAAKSFTFDYLFDSPMSCQEILDAMAAVGMGAIAWPSGKLGVVWAAEDQPVEGVVNMATIKARSFQVNYQTAETADGIEYAYFDRDRDFKWRTLRVVDPSAASSLNPARISSIGVTSEAHAAVLARFHLAQSVFQRKDIGFDTDLEHLTYRRMSVLALTHDVTQWGYGGRLVSAVDDAGYLTLTLDAEVPPGDGSRYIGLRIPGELGYRVFSVASFVGSSRTITLTTLWPDGVAVPGESGNPAMDTIWIYDFQATPGYTVRVTGITPQAGLTGATVRVVPESTEFWDYVWDGEYTPPVSETALQYSPPIVSRLGISEELARQGNTYFVELTVTFDVAQSYGRAEVWGAISGGVLQKLGETRTRRFNWRGSLSEVWTIEVRPFSPLGRLGTTGSTTYAVVGLAVAPANYDTFTITFQPDGTREFQFAYTSTEAPLDLAGPVIRYINGIVSSPDWGDMSPLNSGTFPYPSSPYETNALLAGDYTFAIRAVDTTGNLSTTPLYIQATLPDRRLGNVLDEFYEHSEGWTGTKTDCHVIAGVLEADNTDTWADLSTWTAWSTWNAAPASPIVYQTPVRDLGAMISGGINSDIEAAGSASIELRTSDDDITWSSWGVASALFEARYIQLRVTVTATLDDPVAGVTAWTVQVQANIKTETINDIDISTLTGAQRIGTGDIRVPINETYSVIKRVSVAIQDSTATSWTWAVIDKTTTGPRLQFRSAGTLADPALVDFYIEGS